MLAREKTEKQRRCEQMSSDPSGGTRSNGPPDFVVIAILSPRDAAVAMLTTRLVNTDTANGLHSAARYLILYQDQATCDLGLHFC